MVFWRVRPRKKTWHIDRCARRINPRKQLKRDKPDVLSVPDKPNMTLSMDRIANRLGAHVASAGTASLELEALPNRQSRVAATYLGCLPVKLKMAA